MISTFDSIYPKDSINSKDLIKYKNSINPKKKLPDAFVQKVLKLKAPMVSSYGKLQWWASIGKHQWLAPMVSSIGKFPVVSSQW